MLVNNCDRMAIRSRRDIPKKTGEAQLLGPSEFDAEIVTPVSPPLGLSRPSDLALIGADNGRSPSRPNTIRTRYTGPQPPLPRPPSFAELPTSPQREMRNQSRYSIFPTRASQRPVSWSTIPTRSDHESVQLPAPLFATQYPYTRNNSDGSSATVQIGFRLSDSGQEESNPPYLSLSPQQDTWDTPTVLRRTIHSMSDYSDESPELAPTTPQLRASRSYGSISRPSLSSQWEEQRQQMMTKSLPAIPPLLSPGIPPTPRLNQSPIPRVPPLPSPGIPPTPRLNQSPLSPGRPLPSPGIPPTPRLNQSPLPPIPPLPRAEISSDPRFTVISIGLPANPRPITMTSVRLPPTPQLSIPRLPSPRIVDHPPMPTDAASWSPMPRDNWNPSLPTEAANWSPMTRDNWNPSMPTEAANWSPRTRNNWI